ncbi:DNA/RNA non-specific endonuclease [Aquimarina addita]|uniref:DNA/RNA non-specific endonuclease n=1 Tax=Aquimarina addita TaxID=870485 RepID=A0ABP6UMF1_9FLAO
MRRKYTYPILIILVTIGFYYFENYQGDGVQIFPSDDSEDVNELSFFYLPTSTTSVIVSHTNYSLSYAESHEQAEWVAYELKKDDISRNEFKRPFFEEDKKIRSVSADWRNYKNSGYDKGHLCPAADREFSFDAFKETFLTSNISPQNHEFNAGIWNRLEQKVRYWAKQYDGVYVVTGGVLRDGLASIGYEGVSVPKHFYKIILDTNLEEPKIIAFLIPHKATDAPFEQFVVSVDTLEKLTGIDFFPKLEDDLEHRLEASSNKNGWKF